MRITKKDLEELGYNPEPELVELFDILCNLSEKEQKKHLKQYLKNPENSIKDKFESFTLYWVSNILRIKFNLAPSQEFKDEISKKYKQDFDILYENEEIDLMQEFAMNLATVLTKDEKSSFFEKHLEEIFQKIGDDTIEDLTLDIIYWAEIYKIKKAEMANAMQKLLKNIQ